jgi:hypothetical protein
MISDQLKDGLSLYTFIKNQFSSFTLKPLTEVMKLPEEGNLEIRETSITPPSSDDDEDNKTAARRIVRVKKHLETVKEKIDNALAEQLWRRRITAEL